MALEVAPMLPKEQEVVMRTLGRKLELAIPISKQLGLGTVTTNPQRRVRATVIPLPNRESLTRAITTVEERSVLERVVLTTILIQAHRVLLPKTIHEMTGIVVEAITKVEEEIGEREVDLSEVQVGAI